MYREYEKIKNFFFHLQLLKLKLFGAKIGKNIKVFGRFIVLGHPKKLEIGDNVTINEGVFLNCRDKLTIKDGVRLSAYSKIYTAQLEVDHIPRHHTQAPVTIEKNVWLATSSIVLCGVTIGENSVIAANSVVTKDVEKNALYAGIPAKKIRDLHL